MTQRIVSYSEEESLAIVTAENEGKPHPFPEKEAQRLGRARHPDKSHGIEVQGASPETHNIINLSCVASWSDDKRAMPGEFIACALFSSMQEKDAEYLQGVQLASINGLTVTYTGHRLTQVHADVWEAIMHKSRQQAEGSIVRFRERELLALMNRGDGKSQRDQLKTWLRHLSATCVEIRDQKGRRFWGSLLPRGADKPEGDDTVYAIEINRDLAMMFQSGVALIDWNQRQELRGKWLALWLQRHFARFRRPMTTEELYRLSGSTTKRLVDFRKQLRLALTELQNVEILASWRLDARTDAVHVTFPGKQEPGGLPTPAKRGASDSHSSPQGEIQGSLPLSFGPTISPEARSKFRELYPGKDVDRCLADFSAWLSKSGKTADRPDAAFLGFARKWAAPS